jgi:Mg/Co/Ni transporter MgtE
MIRGGNLSRSERIIALVIGSAVFAVSLFGLVLAIQQKHLRLMVAAIGGLCIAALFLFAAVVGRPMS